MYYVYFLQSLSHKNEIYIGSTNNLRRRFVEHNEGANISTKRYKPWKLVYYEAFQKEDLARMREKKLKYHGNALKQLKIRLGLPSTILRKQKSGAGFTLIELLLIIGLVAILGVMGAGVGGAMLGRNNVRVASDKLVTALGTARSYSMSGREDSNWGVNIAPNLITTYKGASYASRDQTWDEEYLVASGVSVDSGEVVFSKITGETSPVSILVSGNGGVTRAVIVNSLGLAESL